MSFRPAHITVQCPSCEHRYIDAGEEHTCPVCEFTVEHSTLAEVDNVWMDAKPEK